MQTATTTPAESLLLRLLCSENFENDYDVSVEKSEAFTSLLLLSKPESGRQNMTNVP